tara:strand:+ start:1791 stop:2687 length:897 start_codon:yes stop_codon:yes gene_type:complete
MTIAWLFPGQGSQKSGMANSVIDLEGAKERFECFSNILKRDLLEICSNTEIQDNQDLNLNNTKNTQPALFIVESILLDALKKQGRLPSIVAGHSLGEITALYAAEVLSLEDCFNLINLRSKLMSECSEGSMAAIIGFNREELVELINNSEDIVLANDNSDMQVVVSGTTKAISLISENIKCKKFIELNVSGAFHSPFMKDAADKVSVFLDKISFKNPIVPVISNSNPTLTTDPQELKFRLRNQMCNGVRWRETMKVLESNEISTFLEIGPGNVLTGIAKRSVKGINLIQISNKDDLGY